MLTKKDEAVAKRYIRETPKEDQAFGWVTEGKKLFPGTYRFMPILGWIADPLPKGETTKKLILSGALLKLTGETFVGMLDWSLPITERTEETILALLAAFGWDLRVWPEEAGWPDESTEERIGLNELLIKKRKAATLTFPPGPDGNSTMTIHVLKVSNPFPLPPSLTVSVAPPTMLRERFRSLSGADF